MPCPLSTVHEAGASKFHNVPRKKRVLLGVTTKEEEKTPMLFGTRNWNLPSFLLTPHFPPLPLCTYPFKVVAAHASISSSLNGCLPFRRRKQWKERHLEATNCICNCNCNN